MLFAGKCSRSPDAWFLSQSLLFLVLMRSAVQYFVLCTDPLTPNSDCLFLLLFTFSPLLCLGTEYLYSFLLQMNGSVGRDTTCLWHASRELLYSAC